MEAAAKNLTSVSLELGGKSPAIFDETAPMAAACERMVWGKFVNAGQTCIAPDYAWVPESRLEEFLAETRKAIEKAYGPGPDAWKGSDDLARIINERNFGRLKTMLDQTVAAGGKVAIGGETDAGQKYIAPTVVTGVKPSHSLMSEEIFGPILPVMTYKSLEGEVLPFIRAGDRPLALYVFSGSSKRVREVLDQTMSGGVCVNNTLVHIVSPHLPFGGVGPSGMGKYHGEFGFKEFSHERAVVYQEGPNITRLFFPPYTPRVKKLMALAMRFLS
jgi:aldehyde dehydrogenase (NAD+)